MEKNNRSEGGDGRIERKFEKVNWEFLLGFLTEGVEVI